MKNPPQQPGLPQVHSSSPTTDLLRARAGDHRSRSVSFDPAMPWWMRCGLALIIVLAVTAFRLALHPIAGERMGYIFYLPALAAVGWWLGLRAYLLAASVALLIAEVLFIPRVDWMRRFAPGDLFQAILYMLVIAAMAGVIWQARRSERRATLAAAQRAEAEEHLSAFIGNVTDYAIFRISRRGIVTSWNPAVRMVLGYDREEFIGVEASQLFPEPAPDDPDPSGRELATAAAEGSASDERWMRRQDGSRFWASGITSAIHNARGEVTGFTQVVRDLTDALSAREQLEESKERSAAVIELALDGIITMDDQGRIVEFNPAAERIFGHVRDQVIGLAVADIIIPERLREAHWRGLQHFRLTGEGPVLGRRVEMPAVRADGTEIPVELAISAKRFPSGRLLFTASLRDLTERKAAEAALAAANERFRLMADAAPVLIWVADTEKSSTWFNQGWLNFTGRSLEQESGFGWAQGVHTDDYERCIRAYTDAFDRREPFEIEYRLRRRDGEYRWLLGRGIPYMAAPGTFGGYVGACIDITEARSYREAVARQAEDLARSNTDLQDFAYIVSHALKEPLRGISNYATFFLEDHPLDEAATGKIETIHRLARRAYDLLDAILEFSRVGRDRITMQELEASELFARALDQMRNRIEEEGAVMTVKPCPVTIYCDPDLALQALTNLINNALKYNESDPKRVELGCGDTAHGPALYVRDNGIGIDPRHQPSIFRMFKRLHARDRYGGGTGAGLAIVKRIVERHDGRIWVESEPGRGTTFYFTLGQAPAERAPVRVHEQVKHNGSRPGA